MNDALNALLQALVREAIPHVVQAATQAIAGNQPSAGAVPYAAPNTPAAAAQAAFIAPPAAAPAAAPAAGMFGAPAAVVPAAPAVTPDMVQQLITPLVQNEQVKAALMAQMAAMNIANLPDTRPDQLAELYGRFQEVERQAKAAGLIGGAPAAAPSII